MNIESVKYKLFYSKTVSYDLGPCFGGGCRFFFLLFISFDKMVSHSNTVELPNYLKKTRNRIKYLHIPPRGLFRPTFRIPIN